MLTSVLTGTHAQSAMNQERQVGSAPELVAAAGDTATADIVVVESLSGLQTLQLGPGKRLRGADSNVTLHFAAGQDGVQLSSDDQVENLALQTDPQKRALFNDTQVERLGRLVLCNLRTTGVIQLLARDKVRSGHVEAENVDIVAADARIR